MSALLTAEDLSIGHGRRVVATGISLSLPKGQVTCLLGPNGGGKTTLLRTLLGLAPPLAGRVLLGGVPIASLSRTAVARRLAYVPQATTGGFAYTAQQAVAMGRAARLPFLAAPGRQDEAVALAALDRLGIAALAHRPVTELSGGERQLVLIARALAQEAACLVLDEPTASLDFGNQVLVLRQLKRLAADGISVLLTTHQPDHALMVADQVALLMRDGSWHGAGPPGTMITAETLRSAYGVDSIVAEIPSQTGMRLVCVPVLGDR